MYGRTIIVDGSTGDYARMNLHFMNGATEVAKMIVKNGDTRDELNTIIYDPGVGNIPEGTIFKGWWVSDPVSDEDLRPKTAYTVGDADSGKNIDDIRDWVDGLTVTENEDRYVYAMLYKNYVINYLDENNVGVGSDNIFMLSDSTESPYTVNMAYTPKDDTHAFLGWNVAAGSSNIKDYEEGHLFENGESIVITGNVTFSVKAPEGHWFVFDENGKGGTYNAPVFLENNDVTQKPVADSEMTRFGYTFGGWYDTKDHADAHGKDPSVTEGQFQFGNTISDRTTIYASWIPAATANYTILIWKQNVSGNGYDFAETVTGTANVGESVPLGNTISRNYTGFHLKETPADVEVVPEGNAVVNVYYDRTEYTLSFQVQGYIYTETTGNNGTQYGLVDGEYVQLTRHGSGWGSSYYWTYGDTWMSEGTRYTGTRYTRSQGWQTVKTITALYEQNIAENFPIQGTDGTDYAGYVYEPQGSTVFTTGDVPTLETMPAESTVFHIKNYGGGNTYHLYYYLEALDGQQYDVSYNGKHYIEHQHVRVNASGLSSTESEDFYAIDGFTQYDSNPKYNNGRANFDSNRSIRLYYTRDKYSINYMDGVYVDGNGNEIDEEKEATWGSSSELPYQSDISSYNKDEEDYYSPTKAGYAFEGWYLDDACTQPCTFTTMPKGGITVYAKWRQIQYRVFLHPNADQITDLDWGSSTQSMNFRVSIGGTISVPTGRSQEWEFVGWYTDPSCAPSSLFASDMRLNESTVITAYDKDVDMTDPMDKWGHGATTNADVDRFWITKKFDLYAKWRSKLIGANGIGVKYDAGEGTHAPTDENTYLDQAQATAQGASTAPQGKQFVKWIIQTWDKTEGKYVDKMDGDDPIGVYPGDSFEVLKNDAKYVITGYANPEDPADISATKDETHTEIVATYTVQLRAEYVDTGAGVPTHINWYGNNETESDVTTGFVVTDENVMINQAIDAKPADTFTYEGHKFLGWARVPITDEDGEEIDPTLESKLSGKNLTLEELGVADLFLKYVEASESTPAHYEATAETTGATSGTTVSKVAPDERYPYHAMVAVWEVETYKVTIKKKVEGITTDQKFIITYGFDDTELTGGSVTLEHGGSADITQEIPYGTTITLTENVDGYDKSFAAAKTEDGEGTAPETVGDGVFKIKGDTTITVTNTRQKGTLEISKATNPEGIAGTKTFQVSVKNSADEFLQDTSTISFGTEEKWFDVSVGSNLTIENLPIDTYVVTENTAAADIDGYRFNGVTYSHENGSIVVTKDQTANLAVTNSYTKLANVTVTKNLVDNYPGGSTSFKFTPELTENDVDITSQYITDLTEGKFELTPTGEGTNKTASITFNGLPVGATLTITETADEKYDTTIIVNGSAASVASLTIADSNTVEFTNTRKAYVVDFKKTAEDGRTVLSDAKFTLSKNNGSAYEKYEELTLGTDHLELISGDYELKETKAPDGYIISDPVILHVAADGTITVDETLFDDGSVVATLEAATTEGSKGTVTVKNKGGAALPMTGGIGTMKLYTLGGIMILLSALMNTFICLRRRERRYYEN